jgi:ferredoxin
MADLVAGLVEDLGLDPGRVYTESFTPGVGVPGAGSAGEVTVVHRGTRRSVVVPAGGTVLDAGLAAGLDLPFDCRVGVCGTCRAEVRCGPARPAEVVSTCRLPARADLSTVDYDAVREAANA